MRAPITIIIPTSGRSQVIEPLLHDLRAQTIPPEMVHIVVNNHRDTLRRNDWDKAYRATVSYLSPRHYFTRGVNVALRQVNTRYVAVVNDDIRLANSWIEASVNALDQHPQYGSLASRVTSLRFPDLLDCCGDSLYTSGLATNNGWRESIATWNDPCEVFSTSGCLATYRTADIRCAGFLDDDYVAYMEDVDLGFRLQLLGRPCLYWPLAEAGHIGGATRKGPARAARLVERNSLITIVKNFPTSLVRRALIDILAGHLSPCSFEGNQSFAAWSWGKLSAAWHLNGALRKRGPIQLSRSVSDDYIHAIVRKGHPSICHL